MTVGAPGLFGRITAGLGAQGLSILVRLTQQIVMVPLFLYAWDAMVYQDWLLLTAAVSFLGLADLGLRHYLGNVLLIAWSKGEPAVFDRTLRTGLAIYAGVAVAAVPIIAVLAWTAVNRGLLSFGAVSSDTVLFAIGAMVFYTLLAMPQGVMFSIYAARGDVARGVNLATAAVATETVAVCVALWWRASPAHVALVYMVAIVTFTAVLGLDLARRYPDIRFRPIVPSSIELGEKLRRAIDYVVIPMAQAAVLHGTVLILGALAGAGTAPVVAYTAMRTLANLVRQIVNQAGQITSIELTRLHAAGDRDRLAMLYRASARFLGGVGGLLAGAVLAVAPDFLALWTGGKVAYDAWAFSGLLGAVVLALPGHIAMLLLYASNQPRALTKATVAFGLTGMIVAVPAAHWAGPAGVAWALALTELATIGLLPWRVARDMGLPALGTAVTAWAAAVIGLVLGFGIAFAMLTFISERSINALVLVGVFWCGIVALPAFFLVLDSEGRRRVIDRLRGK